MSAIYLDHAASTPLDPQVIAALQSALSGEAAVGNPSATTHAYGRAAAAQIEQARERIAALIGAAPREIVFTSGATESDNLAVFGVAKFYADKGRHIITTQIEHKAILDAAHHLEKEGYTITFLPVDKEGRVDPQQVADAIRPDTILCSVMWANNEIGTVQDITAIGAICRAKGVIFHTDAVQGLGRIPFDVNAMNVDLASISAHKIYGPKGIGALYVRRARPRIRLEPMLFGGGQERGLRSGTQPVQQIVALGKAAELAQQALTNGEVERVRALRDRLWDGLRANLDELYLNGSWENRLPHNLNVSFAYCEGEAIMMAIKNLAVSSGSACTSSSLEPSYVLRAMGVDVELAHTSIRFGVGRFTTEEEIDYAIQLLTEKIRWLRDMSPLYEMVKEGIDLKSVQWVAH